MNKKQFEEILLNAQSALNRANGREDAQDIIHKALLDLQNPTSTSFAKALEQLQKHDKQGYTKNFPWSSDPNNPQVMTICNGYVAVTHPDYIPPKDAQLGDTTLKFFCESSNPYLHGKTILALESANILKQLSLAIKESKACYTSDYAGKRYLDKRDKDKSPDMRVFDKTHDLTEITLFFIDGFPAPVAFNAEILYKLIKCVSVGSDNIQLVYYNDTTLGVYSPDTEAQGILCAIRVPPAKTRIETEVGYHTLLHAHYLLDNEHIELC